MSSASLPDERSSPTLFVAAGYSHGRDSEHASTARHEIGVLSLAASDFLSAPGAFETRQTSPRTQFSTKQAFIACPGRQVKPTKVDMSGGVFHDKEGGKVVTKGFEVESASAIRRESTQG